MRPLLIAASFFALTAPASAGEPDDMLTVGGAFIGACAPGELTSYGVGGMVEGRYNLTGMFSLGVRAEGEALFGAGFKSGGQNLDVGQE